MKIKTGGKMFGIKKYRKELRSDYEKVKHVLWTCYPSVSNINPKKRVDSAVLDARLDAAEEMMGLFDKKWKDLVYGGSFYICSNLSDEYDDYSLALAAVRDELRDRVYVMRCTEIKKQSSRKK